MASDLITPLVQATERTFVEQGEKLVSFVKQNLSVPVAVSITKSGKRKVTGRSKVGEHPRVDKDVLRANIDSTVTVEGDRVTLELFSPTPYASKLQEEMGRVIFNDVIDAKGDELLDALIESFQTKES